MHSSLTCHAVPEPLFSEVVVPQSWKLGVEISCSVIWSFFLCRKLSAGCFPNKTILVFSAASFKSACVTEFASYVKVKSHFRGAQRPPGLRVSIQGLLWQCFLLGFLWCVLSVSWPGLPRAFSFLLQTSQLSDLLWKIRCSYMSYLDVLDVSWV